MNKTDSAENRRHSSPLVPFSYYKCLIPKYFSSVPMHWHSEFEINYILEGRIKFICGDETIIAEQGDILIVPPNMLHAVFPYDEFEQRYDTLVFSAEILGANENDRCSIECVRPIVVGEYSVAVRISHTHQYYNELKTTIENVFSCARGDSARLDMLLKSELLRFFWLLIDNGDIYPSRNRENQSEVIRPVLEYINENFSEDITIEQLATIVHLSPSYFMSRFRKAAGVSAMEYVNHTRIKAACLALQNDTLTSCEIAYECGFKNLSNFNRHFLRIVGCTPREYRKTLKNMSDKSKLLVGIMCD